ncbi:unknown [Prevotella sp. CAG:1185]|nr:unknown [Prevotella sp. CAG:1185]
MYGSGLNGDFFQCHGIVFKHYMLLAHADLYGKFMLLEAYSRKLKHRTCLSLYAPPPFIVSSGVAIHLFGHCIHILYYDVWQWLTFSVGHSAADIYLSLN